MTDLHIAYQKHEENRMQGEDFQALETRILKASREKRMEESCRVLARHSHDVRSAVACVCAVAVAGGSALVYGALQKGRAAMASGQSGSLSLSVYAAGTEGVVPAVTAGNAAGVRGFNFVGAENVTDFSGRRVMEDFTFDFGCEGKNIKTLKYEIRGKAKFAVSGRGANHSNPYEYLPKEQTFSSFLAKQGDDLSSYRIHVAAPVTAEEEARLKAEKNGELNADESGVAAPSHTVAEVKINDVLNGTVVSVTASFNDGSVKTVRYQLSAVKDYLKVLQAYYDAAKELEKTYYAPNDADTKKEKEYEQRLDELNRNTKFYCITQLR